jgi:hypothetical protein
VDRVGSTEDRQTKRARVTRLFVYVKCVFLVSHNLLLYDNSERRYGTWKAEYKISVNMLAV